MPNLIKTLFTDQMITALCNTLLYSLVGGVFLAIAAGLIMITTNKLSAARRYNLLAGALALFTVSMVAIFCIQFTGRGQVPVSNPTTAINVTGFNSVTRVNSIIADNNAAQTPVTVTAVVPGFMQMATNYLNTYQDIIVLIWFLIICVKGIQLMVGLQGVYRLKHTDVAVATGNWPQTLQRLINNLGVKQKVVLLESGLAKVPMVIGHLKPIILIPVGLLTALSTAELEAILMHELAHIRRRDYLVNLLQCLVEIVFFFNPAVLWVTQLIKTEREHCCDDIALVQNTSRADYISALIRCEEYLPASAGYAMAMSGNRNGLLARAKRIATKHNNSLNIFEKTLLTVCVMASVVCFSAFAKKDGVNEPAEKIVNLVAQVNPPKPQTNKAPATPVQKQKTDDLSVPERAYVNQILDKDKIYKAAWDAELKANPKAGEIAKYHTNAAREYINNHLFVMLVEDGLIGKKRGSIDNMSFSLTKQGELIVNGVKQSENLYQKYNKSMHSPMPGPVEYSYSSTTYVNKPGTTIEPKFSEDLATRKKQMRPVLLNELLKSGFVKDTNNIKFTLTVDDFTLNGVKQATEISKIYKAKYLGDKFFSWGYSRKGDAANNTSSESFAETARSK